MKRTLLILMVLPFIVSLKPAENMQNEYNPLLESFSTPFGVPPFSEIKNTHYLPAFRKAIELQKEEINAITQNPLSPDFENTIAAFDNSGRLLNQARGVFYNLLSANTSKEMQDIAKEVAPMLSSHDDDIFLNKALFERVEIVYNERESANMDPEQMGFLEQLYRDFIRKGANLNEEQKTRLRAINEELSLLSLRFGDNVLAETNNFKMVIENEKDLAGLPGNVILAAAEAAREAGLEGKWLFTVQKPSMIPFLQYAENRALREKLFNGYIGRGNQGNEFNNEEIISQIVALRLERANLLGYPTHAHYILEKNMAGEPDRVYGFLRELMDAALPVAQREAQEMQQMIKAEGGGFSLQPWDWWYYAEKIRKKRYDLDEEQLRPYFELNNVREGLFSTVNKLYGLKFIELDNLPVYHKDVKAYEVREADGTHTGILYMDFFPRPSKRAGAWMNSYRKQSRMKGEMISPVITTVFNFTRPSGDEPALLSLDEVLTMYHEMGHALHGLLSNCTYRYLSGTSVPRDFVELPSQIMENWVTEPEVMKSFAKHYQSGDPIPDQLIAKLSEARHFNQGFETVEYLAASFLDMDWHTLTQPLQESVNEFENASMERINMLPEIVVRYKSTYFSHVFSGGYSSGYYSYLWAEVLDSDAFQAFKETSLFDASTAKAFRTMILEKGGAGDPMKMYVSFRGHEPDKEALLRKRGLN